MSALDFSGWAGDGLALLLLAALFAVLGLLIPACRRLIARMEAEGN